MKIRKDEILMDYVRHKKCHKYFISLFHVFILLTIKISCVFPQIVRDQQRIYFISDVQAPLPVEKVILKAYRNEEARDCLFSDIISQHPGNLFILGDLTSRGSNENAWTPINAFLNSLKRINTRVYAIPGNHEYMGISLAGIQIFKRSFKEKWLYGYFVNIDSVAIIMLNSNFNKLNENELSKQLIWYKSEMDSLDTDPAIKAIIVGIHHAPYSNSKIVGSSKQVADLVVPVFEKSQKSKLFISGHSHNLEYFSDSIGKHFLVIGGGGGIEQPLIPVSKRIYFDLIDQDVKPLYFYLIIEKKRNGLKLIVRGFKKDFRFFELDIGIV
jgi:predicted MPP superfamily phosphohydrolase